MSTDTKAVPFLSDDKPTEGAPLLSDIEVGRICDEVPWPATEYSAYEAAVLKVRNFYENLITSGELITKKEHERLLKEAEDGASFRWSE